MTVQGLPQEEVIPSVFHVPFLVCVYVRVRLSVWSPPSRREKGSCRTDSRTPFSLGIGWVGVFACIDQLDANPAMRAILLPTPLLVIVVVVVVVVFLGRQAGVWQGPGGLDGA